MGCKSCSTGRGDNNLPGGCGSSTGSCSSGGCNKLNVFDWLAGTDVASTQERFDIIEVRFKNDRKEFFHNVDNVPLQVGDVIACEASPGHDIGTVSLTGELVRLQMIRKGLKAETSEVKKVYRKARQGDIEKWESAISLEKETMMKARDYAVELGLDMKIGDVEFQGDRTKATFYYIADGRVDFRQLIKKYAENFKVRVEMRQIGARQEASKIGGIGACGRELCCSSWLTNFKSVTTNAARYQQLSLNPQKLAGQCGKLKCCLNFELDSYLDAIRDFPKTDKRLKTKKGEAFHLKTDIFKGLLWYAYRDESHVFIPVSKERVKEILEMNEKGEMPEDLKDFSLQIDEPKQPDYNNVDGQDDLTRFDSKKKKKKKPNRKPQNKSARPDNRKPTTGDKKPQRSNPNQKKKPNPRPNPNAKSQAKPTGEAKEGGSSNKKPVRKKFKPRRKPNNGEQKPSSDNQ